MEFENIINNIQEKLGDENSALISEELLNLNAYNVSINETISNNHNEIEKLKLDKDNLIKVNGSLYQKIGNQIIEDNEKKEENNNYSNITFNSLFDEKGNFIN